LTYLHKLLKDWFNCYFLSDIFSHYITCLLCQIVHACS